MNKELYYDGSGVLLEKILDDPNYDVIIASFDEDHDLIYGYIIVSRKIDNWKFIKFLFVKYDFRGRGIAKGLLKFVGKGVNHFYTDCVPYTIKELTENKFGGVIDLQGKRILTNFGISDEIKSN